MFSQDETININGPGIDEIAEMKEKYERIVDEIRSMCKFLRQQRVFSRCCFKEEFILFMEESALDKAKEQFHQP